jgi:4-hydroxy-tetrahydrodipicolinate synthase
MSDVISGLWVALPTPLTEAGLVDHAALVRHAQWLLTEGADGFVPFGTTGEGTSFSAAERLATVEAMLAAGIDAGRIGLGAGFPALPDAVALTRSALSLGLRHVLLLPPYFYRDVTAQGIEDAFASVIDAVGDDRLRVTLYHIPQTSGVGVPASAAAALRARFGTLVAGLKDSSGDYPQFQAFRAAAPEIAVTVGNEPDIGRAVKAGGAGTICGMANIAPGLVRAMFTDPDAAGPMAEATGQMKGPFVPTLKAVLAAQTGEAGWLRVRAPLRSADPAVGARIAQVLQGLLARKAA